MSYTNQCFDCRLDILIYILLIKTKNANIALAMVSIFNAEQKNIS